MGSLISVPSGDSFIFHAERAHSLGPIGVEVVHHLNGLRPHLARSALTSGRLALERASGAVAALEMIGLPAAVLGWGGKIIASNLSLNSLIPDIMHDLPTRLALSHGYADELLSDALASLDRGPHNATIRSIPIPAQAEHPPMIVHLNPIKGAAHDIFSGAMALLIATPVIPGKVPSATVIQGLFDLTPAEARLAGLIVGNVSTRKAAAMIGCSYETVRTTLQKVLSKTGTSRQAELVALLSGHPRPPAKTLEQPSPRQPTKWRRPKA